MLVRVHNVSQLVTVIFVTQFVNLNGIEIEKVNKFCQGLDAALLFVGSCPFI